MEFPGGVQASDLAYFPRPLVVLGAFFLAVEEQLHGALHVSAELPRSIFYVAGDWHGSTDVRSFGANIKLGRTRAVSCTYPLRRSPLTSSTAFTIA